MSAAAGDRAICSRVSAVSTKYGRCCWRTARNRRSSAAGRSSRYCSPFPLDAARACPPTCGPAGQTRQQGLRPAPCRGTMAGEELTTEPLDSQCAGPTILQGDGGEAADQRARRGRDQECQRPTFVRAPQSLPETDSTPRTPRRGRDRRERALFSPPRRTRGLGNPHAFECQHQSAA